MRNYLGALVALLGLIVVSALGTTLSAETASATESKLLQSATADVCGEVTFTFTNNTKFNFTWEIKNVTTGEFVDAVVLSNADDAVTTATDSVTLQVTETTTFSYGNTEGAETDWYLPFKTIIGYPCEPEPTESSGETPSSSASSTPPSSETIAPSETTAPSELTPTVDPVTTTTVVRPIVRPRFANCAEVRAAGQAPILVGTPGFHPDLDADGDGLGCEREEAVSEVAHDDGDLASTGTGDLATLVFVGTLLLIGGAVATTVAVRRRRSGGTT